MDFIELGLSGSKRPDSLLLLMKVARPLATHRTALMQNKRTQTSMPDVGFKPTIPVFERAKTVHALDRAGTAIGLNSIYSLLIVLAHTHTQFKFEA
jgi:hypothetical protein